MAPYRDLLDSCDKLRRKLAHANLFKKYNCPICGKELIRLDAYGETSERIEFDYRCKECDVIISINAPKTILNEKEND